jgi:hypothetical protein
VRGGATARKSISGGGRRIGQSDNGVCVIGEIAMICMVRAIYEPPLFHKDRTTGESRM